MKNTLEGIHLAKICYQLADDKKCLNPVILDVSHLDAPTDFFVICSGQSNAHIKAIAENVEVSLKEKHKLPPFAHEGNTASQWFVVDYGDVIVHVFSENLREHYALEELWKDGSPVSLPDTPPSA